MGSERGLGPLTMGPTNSRSLGDPPWFARTGPQRRREFASGVGSARRAEIRGDTAPVEDAIRESEQTAPNPGT
jgi:hypothetical protein